MMATRPLWQQMLMPWRLTGTHRPWAGYAPAHIRGYRGIGMVLVVLATLFAMPADAARMPDMVKKEVVLTGDAAISLARLFGLTSAKTLSLPLWKSTAVLMFGPPDPQLFNTLKFSPGREARLSLSPHWWDLQTALPQRPGYAFSASFLPRNLNVDNPWAHLVRQLQKETPRPEWHAMEIDTNTWKHTISRCFTSEKKLKLCIEVYGTTNGWPATGKTAEYGYAVDVTAQDMTLPAPPTTGQIFSEKRAAASKGDADAQFWLCQRMTELFDDGYSYPLDPVQAADWCRKAAAQGYKWAPGQLGSMYERGLGVTRDNAQAMIWYRKGAEKGDINAQFWLCQKLSGLGDGGGSKPASYPLDPAQAVLWCHKAAAQGHKTAQAYLGIMYGRGLGVTRDNAQAAFWRRKATDSSDVFK